MPRWTLSWQSGPLEVELPDDSRVQVIERPEPPALGTPVELVRKAIERPLGCPPLVEMVKPGDRVALLVTDTHDRQVGQEGVGDLLLDLLNSAGVPDKNVTLIHAAGMHGHPRARGRVGEALIGRVARYVGPEPYEPDRDTQLAQAFAQDALYFELLGGEQARGRLAFEFDDDPLPPLELVAGSVRFQLDLSQQAASSLE